MTWAVHRLDDALRRLQHGLPRLVHLLRSPRPDRTNAIGRTDLMLAALSGNTARVPLLAPWNEVDRQDALGRTALMHAARKGRLGAVRALLPYANPNLQDHDGQTALTLTITCSDMLGDCPTIAHLLGRLSDPNVRYRNTAVLTMTVVHGLPELAREMAGRTDALQIDIVSGSRKVLDIVLERRDWLTATALFEAWPLACTWPSIAATAQPWPEKDRPPELQQLWDRAHAGAVAEEKNALRAVIDALSPTTSASGALRTVRARL